MQKMILLTISLISFSVNAEIETKDFNIDGIKELEVRNLSGKLTITGVTGPKAVVVATKNKFSDNCKMKIERSGKTIKIKVENKGFTGSCDVDFDVKVPQEIDLDLNQGSGKVVINGIQGQLDFKFGSGDIFAEGPFKKFQGKTGSGNIELKGLVAGGELKAGSGNIQLSFLQPIQNGKLDISMGSGNAILNFPKDARIKTSFRTGSGHLSNELGDHANAEFKISVKAGSGNLSIKSI